MAVKVLGSALVSAFVVLSARSAAADDGTPFRLSWVRGEGAGSCPDAATIESRAAQRLGRNPFSETATQSIEGSVVGEGDELKAELRVRDEMGVARGRREIRAKGADCVELADAVVLAVVLTIDPNALLADTTAPAPPSAPPEAPPVAAEPPALDACPVVRCPSPPPCPPARCPAPPPLENMALTARFIAGAGILPALAPGAAVAGEVGGAHVRGSLGIVYFPETAGDADEYAFGLTAGSIGLILAGPLAGGFELSGITELEVGAIHSVVFEGEPVNPGDQPWVAGVLGARFGFLGWAPLRLEIGASLVVPLTRPIFAVRGVAEPAFQSAPVGGMTYLGAGFGLP
jgi:hypothetical protein